MLLRRAISRVQELLQRIEHPFDTSEPPDAVDTHLEDDESLQAVDGLAQDGNLGAAIFAGPHLRRVEPPTDEPSVLLAATADRLIAGAEALRDQAAEQRAQLDAQRLQLGESVVAVNHELEQVGTRLRLLVEGLGHAVEAVADFSRLLERATGENRVSIGDQRGGYRPRH